MGNRDSGIDFVGQVPWGTHLCQFYGTENDHMDMAVPFLAAGLKSNERCVFITSGREQKERALKALGGAVPELEKRISGRQIEFLCHEEWYLSGGSFQPENVLRGWTEMHDRALKAGFEGLRVVGNTLWLEKKLWKSFMEYEEAVNSVISKLNMLALCTYPVAGCGAAELLEAAASHRPAIIKCNGQWKSIEGFGHKASESALKESERRYRLLTEFTSDIVFRMSIRPDGGLDLEWITEAFENVSGYGNWEISSSESFEKLIHPEDAREYRDMLASVLSGRQSDSEVRYISRASEVRWLKLYALPEYYEGTRIIRGVIGRGKDITRRKRAEERLRDSERKHRGLFESISEGILETALDGAVIDCNQACLDMLGYTRDELKTLSISEIAGPPKGRASDENPSGEREYECECLRKDGSTVPVCQRTMPIRDASGAVVGAWRVLKDLSPLKEAGRELDARVEEGTRELKQLVSRHRASEERFRALVETTSDWVWEIDSEGVYTYVSPKVLEVLGYRTEEVVGRNRFDFMVPDEAQCTRAAFGEIAAVRKPFSLVEIRKLRKDGRIVIIETSGAPILDPNGSLLGYRGVDRDITARKVEEEERGRIQDQLIQSQKMEAIGALAGGIAHDFNNLMVVIRLNAELALKREQQKGDIRAFLEQIGIASERAENLTRQLLIFSRKQPTQMRSLNLNAKVDNMLKILKRLIGENIRIKTFFDPGIKKICADKVNIEQIVMNLVINARDALPRGGTITIRTDNVEVSGSDSARTASLSSGAYARLTVEDDGVGIEGGVIRRIFEPFFTTKGPRGTGLGLAVVHGIVKELKGWIDVESKPGAGARFEVYLPAMEWIHEAETRRVPEGPLLGKGERVLVVEDEKLLRKSVAVVLARNGYRVFEASSAKEAIELFEKEKGLFDLVFSDMVLEDKDGVCLVDDLRARNSAFKALITSGYLNVESQWPAIRDRGFNFLQKPYEVTDLLRSIRNAIEN